MPPFSIAPFTDIATNIGKNFGTLGIILFILPYAAIVGWVCFRTNSTHLLTRRIWRLVYGKEAVKDPHLARLIRTRDRLNYFRMMSGINARTCIKADALMLWCEVNDEEISSIKACGKLFDLEACQLRLTQIPSRSTIIVVTLLFALFLLATASTGLLCLPSQAIMKANFSHIWFLLSDKEARPILGQRAVTGKQCLNADGKQKILHVGFTEAESTELCTLLGNDNSVEIVENSVKSQRFVFGTLSASFACFAWQLFSIARVGSVAAEMRKRLDISRRKVTKILE